MREKSRESAERGVRRTLVLEAIEKKEGLTIDEKDVAAEIERMASTRGESAETVRKELEKKDAIHDVEHYLRHRKTLDFLRQHATI